MSDMSDNEDSSPVDDDNRMVKPAKVRSAVSYLLSKASEPMTAAELWKQLEVQMEEVGTNKAAFTKVVEGMGKNGLIFRTVDGHSVKYQKAGSTQQAAPVQVARHGRSKTLGSIDLESLTIGEARLIYKSLQKFFKND